MRIKIPILAIVTIFFFIFFNHTAWSASYDLYVDESYKEDDADGSSAKPYKTLEKAVEEADSGDKIYIKNGTYTGDVILEKGLELYGQDKNKTIITGELSSSSTIIAKGNNVIENITVSGGSSAVTFQGEGKLNKCIVKNARNKGIDLTQVNSKVIITNSKITENKGKGIYVQKDRLIEITNNEFSNNVGEGIDIREKVKGTISGNKISNNTEGGIEIVVGSSEIKILNNNISKNKASGIAAQFYSQAKKTGEVNIQGNSIIQNGKFGLACMTPSGGNTPKGYWNKSLELVNNKIEGNKKKSISKTCKIIDAITEEEEKKNQTLESEEAKNNPEEENEELEFSGNTDKISKNTEAISLAKNQIGENKSFILKQNAKKSLFGWLVRIWMK